MKIETTTTYQADRTTHLARRANVQVTWNGHIAIVEEANYDPYENSPDPFTVTPNDMIFLMKAFAHILTTNDPDQ